MVIERGDDAIAVDCGVMFPDSDLVGIDRELSLAVRDALAGSRVRVSAVAVGSASDLDSLAALARAGGGVVLPYAPGQSLTEATLGVLACSRCRNSAMTCSACSCRRNG